jgi:hypothetical protein
VAGIETKLKELQTVLVDCQVVLTNLQDEELKAEAYLTRLDGERP